jgi:hypothetical protein
MTAFVFFIFRSAGEGEGYFFLGAIHEKHKFKYFKNLTVKQFVKYGAMMSICLFFSVTFLVEIN